MNKIKSKIDNELSALRVGIHSYLSIRKKHDELKWHQNFQKKLKQFENIHKGEECFIIGNGPSLKKMDLDALNNYYIFGLNKIFLLFDKTPLDLSYHVAVNPLVLEQSVKEINELSCPSFISYLASKNLDLSAPHIHKLLTNSPIWAFNKSILQPIHEGFTVTFVAMQIAYFMGFSKVFLIGVDHNFKQSGTPNTIQTLTEDDANHFHPEYFKGMKWHLADIEGNETSYMLAKQIFERDGKKIYDATVDGKLEIFPKISYEDALDLCKTKK